jgi:hypothetical protein
VEGTGGGHNQNKTLVQNKRLLQPRFEVSTSTTQTTVTTALVSSIGDFFLMPYFARVVYFVSLELFWY